MYSFEPSEEQQMLIDVARRFAEKDLRPAAHEAEEHRGFEPGLIEKGWELGVLQASVPDEYGGFGERSALTSILAAEELAWGDLAGALAIMAPSLFVTPDPVSGHRGAENASICPRCWKPNGSLTPPPSLNTATISIPTISRPLRSRMAGITSSTG